MAPGAGARRSGRQACRHLGLRRPALRDARRLPAARSSPATRSATRWPGCSRRRSTSAGCRPPPRVPWRQLLRRCLERNPKNRLHDIADARLRSRTSSRAASTRQPLHPEGSRSRPRRAAASGSPGRSLRWDCSPACPRQPGSRGIGRRRRPRRPPVSRFSPPGRAPSAAFPRSLPTGARWPSRCSEAGSAGALWIHDFGSGEARRLEGKAPASRGPTAPRIRSGRRTGASSPSSPAASCAGSPPGRSGADDLPGHRRPRRHLGRRWRHRLLAQQRLGAAPRPRERRHAGPAHRDRPGQGRAEPPLPLVPARRQALPLHGARIDRPGHPLGEPPSGATRSRCVPEVSRAAFRRARLYRLRPPGDADRAALRPAERARGRGDPDRRAGRRIDEPAHLKRPGSTGSAWPRAGRSPCAPASSSRTSSSVSTAPAGRRGCWRRWAASPSPRSHPMAPGSRSGTRPSRASPATCGSSTSRRRTAGHASPSARPATRRRSGRPTAPASPTPRCARRATGSSPRRRTAPARRRSCSRSEPPAGRTTGRVTGASSSSNVTAPAGAISGCCDAAR